MRILFVTSLIAGLGACAVAAAQPASNTENNPATLCLDGTGYSHPATCHTQSATSFAQAPDICICEGPYREVKAPWCAPGEKPPEDTADFEQARAKAAQRGDLMSATYQGRRMCVPLAPSR